MSYATTPLAPPTTPSTRMALVAAHARRAVLVVGVLGFLVLALGAGVAAGADILEKLLLMLGG